MTHVLFDPNSVDWSDYFQNQHGGAYAVFESVPFQRGFGIGSIFSNLFRFLLPIGKTIGQELGKEMLAAGGRIAGDMGSGSSLKQAIKTQTQEGLKNIVDNIYEKAQSGSGRKKSIKRHNSIIGRVAKKGPKKRIDYLGVY